MSGMGLVQACPWKFEIWEKVCMLFGSGLIIKCIFKTFLQRPLQTFVIIFIHFNKFGDTVCCGRPLPTRTSDCVWRSDMCGGAVSRKQKMEQTKSKEAEGERSITLSLFRLGF